MTSAAGFPAIQILGRLCLWAFSWAESMLLSHEDSLAPALMYFLQGGYSFLDIIQGEVTWYAFPWWGCLGNVDIKESKSGNIFSILLLAIYKFTRSRWHIADLKWMSPKKFWFYFFTDLLWLLQLVVGLHDRHLHIGLWFNAPEPQTQSLPYGPICYFYVYKSCSHGTI